MSSFIGREQEVALLHARWEQATSGEGQGVLLCGEGGIGKSRIAKQLRERIGTVNNFWVRYQCSPFHINSALQPAIAQLEHAAGVRTAMMTISALPSSKSCCVRQRLTLTR
jgi:predicted ATPase